MMTGRGVAVDAERRPRKVSAPAPPGRLFRGREWPFHSGYPPARA